MLRDVNEFILVYSKGRFGRFDKGESTISKEDFLRDTLSVWKFPPESARRVGHPAPFPVELPRRLINLYSYKRDVILDPFMGAGSTACAAYLANRHWIGYETEGLYIELANERLSNLP